MKFFARTSASARATATASSSATATATGTGSGYTLAEAKAAANYAANSAANSAAIKAANSVFFYGTHYANIYSNDTFPKQVNLKEWVPLSGIDTPDFTIDSKDNTKLICNSAGMWQIVIQYQMVYTQPTTISEGNSCLLSGWVNVNGVDVPYSDGTGYLNRVGTKNVLSIIASRYFEVNDVIKFGVLSTSLDGTLYVNCQSYIDKSGVNAPSAIFTAVKADNLFQNFSLLTTPSTLNQNQYAPFSFTDTFNWYYDSDSKDTIVCKNAGYWTFTAQYQMVNLAAASQGSYAAVSGWFNVNDVDVPNSDASSYISLANGKTVFILGYAQYFNAGDRVKIGVRSSNDSLDATLHTVCKSYTNATGVVAPSLLVTAVKSPRVINIFSTRVCPELVNRNEYVPLTDIDSRDFWDIDLLDNNKLICKKTGKWQFLVKYQMVNVNPVTSGEDSEICGWLNINGVDVENSDATGYVARKTALNILTVAFAGDYNAGDVLKFGVRSSSTNNALNAVCEGFLDTTGVYAPSVIITATGI